MQDCAASRDAQQAELRQSTNPLSTVYSSLCIQIIKAALWRGVVMLRDVAWELRNDKLRSTTAITGQPPPATAAEQELLVPSAKHEMDPRAAAPHSCQYVSGACKCLEVACVTPVGLEAIPRGALAVETTYASSPLQEKAMREGGRQHQTKIFCVE